MRPIFFVAGLSIGSLCLFGCEEQAEQASIDRVVNDSPMLGVWYLQAAGDQPVAIDSTIRFEFKEQGSAVYERKTSGPEAPDQYALTYNLAGNILSISGQSDAPGVPNLTGQIEFQQDGQTLRINTHTDEDWLLTRAELPGGEIEKARRFKQVGNRADPNLVRVQRLAYACSAYANAQGRVPERVYDLVKADLVSPAQLTASGTSTDLPGRFDRMTEGEQADWLEANTAFVFFFRYADTNQASSVVVSSLPENGKSKVVVGMANGAVYMKPAKEAAQLIQFQQGELPARWPESAWSRDSTAGLEPLSD